LKAVVFGATGTVGSWTVASLINSGFEVVAVSRSTSPIQYPINLKISQINSDSDRWIEILKFERPDVVLHCDWNGVASSEKNSLAQYLNVERWLELASQMSRLNIPKVIYIGSQAEFGNNLKYVDLETPFSPITKYGEAKVDAIRGLEKIYTGSDTQFVWARLFSMYGALDEGNWLVPSLIRELLNGNMFKLSSGIQKWNYLHYADVAQALSILASASYSNRFFNIGASNQTRILDIAEFVAKYIGCLELLVVQESEVNSVSEVHANIDELTRLGWTQKISLDTGLLKTIEWFRGADQEFSEYGFENLSARLPSYRTHEKN
jgi:nucleoside-diphosphate-sugar epimerase